MEMHTIHQHPIDLHNLINDLKHEIATIVIETCAMVHQQATSMMNANFNQMAITWTSKWTRVGLPS